VLASSPLFIFTPSAGRALPPVPLWRWSWWLQVRHLALEAVLLPALTPVLPQASPPVTSRRASPVFPVLSRPSPKLAPGPVPASAVAGVHLPVLYLVFHDEGTGGSPVRRPVVRPVLAVPAQCSVPVQAPVGH
jgi:hypothetical protein